MSWTGDQEYPGISIIGQPQQGTATTVVMELFLLNDGDTLDLNDGEEFMLNGTESPRKHFSKLPAKTVTFDEEL